MFKFCNHATMQPANDGLMVAMMGMKAEPAIDDEMGVDIKLYQIFCLRFFFIWKKAFSKVGKRWGGIGNDGVVWSGCTDVKIEIPDWIENNL